MSQMPRDAEPVLQRAQQAVVRQALSIGHTRLDAWTDESRADVQRRKRWIVTLVPDHHDKAVRTERRRRFDLRYLAREEVVELVHRVTGATLVVTVLAV